MEWNQVEDYTTQNFLENHQDMDHSRFFKRRQSVSGSIHTRLGIAVFMDGTDSTRCIN